MLLVLQYVLMAFAGIGVFGQEDAAGEPAESPWPDISSPLSDPPSDLSDMEANDPVRNSSPS